MNNKFQALSKSPIHQRRTPQKEESIVNKTYTKMTNQILQPSKSEASLQPLSVHYQHLRDLDMEQLGKEITQKTMQAISKPTNTSTRIQRIDNQGNKIIEEIKPAKKVCSTCLMKDLNMFPSNYKFHANCNDKTHPFMMQDPSKTGNRKIRVIKKSVGQVASKLSYHRIEDMSYEPPIHSFKDLEIEKLRDDNKIEESDAAYQKISINVIQKMKNIIEELINFLNYNGTNLMDNAIENQRLATYISEFTPKNDVQENQLDKLSRRNKKEFELNIQNDDLKQRLRNLQDVMQANYFILNRSSIDQAKDNVIESQKNRIHNQNKNITRLGEMLLKLNQCDPLIDPEGKLNILTQKAIDFSKEIEEAKQGTYNSKKSMDEANQSAYKYMIKLSTLDIDVFEQDVARAQNLLSKGALQYEQTIKILKESYQDKLNAITSLQQEKQKLEDLMQEKDKLNSQRLNDVQSEYMKLSIINKEQMDSLNTQHQQTLKQKEDQKQQLEQQLQKIEQDSQLNQEPSLLNHSSPSFFQDTYTDDNSQQIIQELTSIILNQKNFQDEDSQKALRQIFGKRYLDNFKFFEKQMYELNQKNRTVLSELNQEKNQKKILHQKIEWYTKLLINIHQNRLTRNNLECLEQDIDSIQQDNQVSMLAELEADPTLLGRISVLNGRFSEFNQLYLPPQRESRVSCLNEQKIEENNRLKEENKDLKGTLCEIEGKLSLLESEIQYLQLQNQQLQNKLSLSKNPKEVAELRKEIDNLRRQLNEQSFVSENSKSTISRQNTPTRYKTGQVNLSHTNSIQKIAQFDDNPSKNMSRLNLSSISEFPHLQIINLEDWMQMINIQAITIEEFLDKHQNEQETQEECDA